MCLFYPVQSTTIRQGLRDISVQCSPRLPLTGGFDLVLAAGTVGDWLMAIPSAAIPNANYFIIVYFVHLIAETPEKECTCKPAILDHAVQKLIDPPLH